MSRPWTRTSDEPAVAEALLAPLGTSPAGPILDDVRANDRVIAALSSGAIPNQGTYAVALDESNATGEHDWPVTIAS